MCSRTKSIMFYFLLLCYLISACSKIESTKALEQYLIQESELTNNGWQFYTTQQKNDKIIGYIIFPDRRPGVSRIAPTLYELRRLCPDKSLHTFWDDTGLKSFKLILMKNVDRGSGKATRLTNTTCDNHFNLAAHISNDSEYQDASNVTDKKPVTMTTEQIQDWFEKITIAVRNDDVALTNSLAKTGKKIINMRNDREETLLHRVKSADVAESLINNGAIVDAKTDTNSTPLIYASEHSSTGLAALLLQYGANVNHIDQQKVTALSRSSSKAMSELLITNGATVPENAMVIPAKKGQLDLVKYYYSLNANINARGFFDRSPLHAAVAGSTVDLNNNVYIPIAQWLIENGAELNMLDGLGKTPYDLLENNGLTANPFMKTLLQSHDAKSNKG